MLAMPALVAVGSMPALRRALRPHYVGSSMPALCWQHARIALQHAQIAGSTFRQKAGSMPALVLQQHGCGCIFETQRLYSPRLVVTNATGCTARLCTTTAP
jgi:hypothetical protein